jgi:hypothetical protein
VGSLVTLEVSLGNCVSQDYRLVKAQAKSFSCDSINTSGRVARQCNIPLVDTIQSSRRGNGTSFRAAWFRMAQMAS